jgi:hypothetical protein
MLEQVALQPRRLMRGIAGHCLDPGDPGHHRSQVGPAAEVSPVGQHPAAQADRAADVEDTSGPVTEAVHAGGPREDGGADRRSALRAHRMSPLHWDGPVNK